MTEQTYIHQLLEPDQIRVTGHSDYSVNRICQVLDRIAAGNAKRFAPLPASKPVETDTINHHLNNNNETHQIHPA